MTDHAAIADRAALEVISEALEDYYRGRINQTEAFNQIARIAGANHITHQESK